MINHETHRNKIEIIHFFNKINIIPINTIPEINLIIMHKNDFPSNDEKY